MIIIDRIEGDFAVCECDGRMINIKTELISGDFSEGDCLRMSGGVYITDASETDKRKRRATALLAKFKK